jgi:hypothetical protein
MLINKLKVLKESELRDKFLFHLENMSSLEIKINMIKRNHYILSFYSGHLLIKLSFDIKAN